ncbi:MAG: hypothetical protein ACJ77E_03615 [Gaiellaceae bacterium]
MSVQTWDRLSAARTHELVCGRCGYGIMVRAEPPRCPMCREADWRPIWRRFASPRFALDDDRVAVA